MAQGSAMPLSLRLAARSGARPLTVAARPQVAVPLHSVNGKRASWAGAPPSLVPKSRSLRFGMLQQMRHYTVKTPAFGAESITEGTIMEWNVKAGSAVKKGAVLAVIETDKVTVEVISEEAGVVTEILAKVDATVGVGEALCTVKPGGAAPEAKAPVAAKAPEAVKTTPPAATPPGNTKSLQVKTPEFGAESITEGTVLEINAKVGDFVLKDSIVVVIETDKVSVEVKAPESGTISAVHAAADSTVAVGQPLFDLAAGGTPPAAAGASTPTAAPVAAAPAAAPAVAPTKSVQVKTPEFGAESITEGTVLEINAKVGDFVQKDALIIVIETDKVSVEVKAPESGTISAMHAAADTTVAVGQPLFDLAAGGTPPAVAEASAPAVAPAAAPAAAAPAAPATKAAVPSAKASDQATTGLREERRVKMPRMRQAIARNLKGAQNTAAMLTCFQEVDMTAAMDMRKQYKEQFEKAHGVKLGFMSIFLKASASALRQVPSVNARIDDAAEEIVYREYVDIAFAAASPRGLLTPVMLDVNEKSMRQVEASFAELAGKAKADKLPLEEMTGGTFIVSNGGVFGSMMGTPMLGSTSMSAVLGLHATKMRAVALPSGEIVARPIMYVALTYDHRMVDSREAVTFLNIVRDNVEDPRRLLLL